MRIGHVILMVLVALVFTIVGWQLGKDSGLVEYLDAEIREAISETEFDRADELITDLQPYDSETAARYRNAVAGLKERIENARREAREEAERQQAAQARTTDRTDTRTRTQTTADTRSRTTYSTPSTTTRSGSTSSSYPRTTGFPRSNPGVERAATESRDVIAACYSIGLADDPNLNGRVVVRFTVGTDGKVSSARVESSTIHDDNVEQCVLSTVRSWTFAAGSRSQTFDYPFIFEPG